MIENENLDSWLGKEPPEPEKLSEIEETKKQIETLQQKLKILEHEETVREDWEKAYRDEYGHFPVNNMSCSDFDAITIVAFKKGYEAASIKHKKLQEKEMVMGNLKTSLQELANGDVRPIDDVMKEVKKLQEKDWTYKVTDEKGEMNPYKQYLNGVKTFRQELFDYGFSDSTIGDIILIINRFLPEPIKETCGMKDWDSAWTIGYNNYRDALVEKLK